MAIYECDNCGNFVDDDWNPCEEHPTKDLGLVCPDCVETMPEFAEDDD
jgi:DNA-directed RNA polymerase subunit RPC12/RpoP